MNWKEFSSTLTIILYNVLFMVNSKLVYDCPLGWEHFRNNCYEFKFLPLKSFESADLSCQTNGAILLTIDNEDEHAFIVKILKTKFFGRNKWYTDGMVDPSNSKTYIWRGNGKQIENHNQHWIDVSEQKKEGTRIVYVAKGTSYGWSLTNEYAAHSSICKIAQSEIYRIKQRMRDFNFGYGLIDPQNIKRGPNMTIESPNYIVLEGVTRTSFECVATGNPAVKYKWYRLNKKKVIFDEGITNMGTTQWSQGENRQLVIVNGKKKLRRATDRSWTDENMLLLRLNSHLQRERHELRDRYNAIEKKTRIEITPNERYSLTNGRLTISKPQAALDEGYFQCSAENEFGSILGNPVQITFGLLGEFSNVRPEVVHVKAYEFAMLICSEILFKPKIIYQWVKGSADNFVRPSKQKYIFASTNGRLYFSEVTTADAGLYRCMVKLAPSFNSVMETTQTQSRISLAIPLSVSSAPPKLNWGPEIHSDFIFVDPSPPMLGHNVRLECFAIGSQYSNPFTYEWKKIGGDMGNNIKFSDSNRVLTIENSRFENEGIYRCIVKRGTTGRDEKDYSLIFSGKPKFVLPLKSQHIDIGSHFTWRCDARGRPKVKYSWYKNGVLINEKRDKVSIQGNTLIIESADIHQHSGMYQCSASNTFGISFSGAQLRVLQFKPTFVHSRQPKRVTGAVRGNLSLVCYPESAPEADIMWLKDGISLNLVEPGNKNDHLRMLANGNLFLNDINANDEGIYTCKATNTQGEATLSIEVKIIENTVISYPPADTEVLVNETAFLQCEVSHSYYTDIAFHWLFNGNTLKFENNPHYAVAEVDGHIKGLYIRNTKFYHKGRYECIVITSSHEVSSGAYLNVKGPPFPPSGVSVVLYSSTATTLTLKWLAPFDGGSPILFYMILARHNHDMEWNILTESIKETPTLKENSHLRYADLDGLIPNATYVFRIAAINSLGVGESSLPSVSHKMDPSSPKVAPKMVGGGGGKVGQLHISWEALPTTQQGGRGIGYVAYWRRVNSKHLRWNKHVIYKNADELFILVGERNFYKQYEVKVQAFNLFGEGPNSTVSKIYSAEGMPRVVPTDVSVITYNGTAVIVTWTQVPENIDDMRGVVLGYQVNYYDRDIENAPTYFQSFFGQISSALIIGLKPNGYYWMTVQVFNTAGLSDLSENYLGKTGSDPPLRYPIEIHIYSHGPDSVRVTFRGVGYDNNEDPIQGYKLCSWLVTEQMNYTKCVKVGIVSSGIIPNLKKNVLYKLRVCGFTGAGDGKLSELSYFTLGGQVRYNQHDFEVLAGSSRIKANFVIIFVFNSIIVSSGNIL